MRVFVLSTGRSGTTTFTRACEHLDNFTAGHETRARKVGPDRFDYPDWHIEVDNRLSWLLGSLGRRFDGTDTVYVHLRRRSSEVVHSFVRRWDAPYRASIIRAFGHGILMRGSEWKVDDVPAVCEAYVDAVTSNIDEFLTSRPSLEVWLHELPERFDEFAGWIGAVGDLDLARAEFAVRHNASE